jgi:hypothetical protein
MKKQKYYAVRRRARFPNRKLAGTYVRTNSGNIALFTSKRKALQAVPAVTRKHYSVVRYKK